MTPILELNQELKLTHKRGCPVPEIFTPFLGYNNSLKITVSISLDNWISVERWSSQVVRFVRIVQLVK